MVTAGLAALGHPAKRVALVAFGAQIALSRWWLRRFGFGPAEWLWRSLTAGECQPMRRPDRRAVLGVAP